VDPALDIEELNQLFRGARHLLIYSVDCDDLIKAHQGALKQGRVLILPSFLASVGILTQEVVKGAPDLLVDL